MRKSSKQQGSDDAGAGKKFDFGKKKSHFTRERMFVDNEDEIMLQDRLRREQKEERLRDRNERRIAAGLPPLDDDDDEDDSGSEEGEGEGEGEAEANTVFEKVAKMTVSSKPPKAPKAVEAEAPAPDSEEVAKAKAEQLERDRKRLEEVRRQREARKAQLEEEARQREGK